MSLLFLAGPALSAVSENTTISPAVMRPLANWVEYATHVQMQVLPVAIASNRKLERTLHIDDALHAGAVGAYIPGRIVLRSDMWDPDSVKAQSYLVHELVHHAQLVSGRWYPCDAAREREAYMLQSQYLTEHEQKPIVTQAWIDTISSCASPAEDHDAD
jgi:hypothetical protein